jgi:hypothetical protein
MHLDFFPFLCHTPDHIASTRIIIVYPPAEPAPITDLEAMLATPFGMILMNTVRLAMPPRMDGFDEDAILRAAFQAFTAFDPRDAMEQMLAAQAVAAHFAAMGYFAAAMNPIADERTADRSRRGAVAMNRSMRDTIKMLQQRRKKPNPTPEAKVETPPRSQPKPLPFAQIEVSPDARPQPNPDGSPRMPDFREKPLNGDPYRDFLSRRFRPDDDVEAAGAEAKRQSAELATEDDIAGSRGVVVREPPDLVACDRTQTGVSP